MVSTASNAVQTPEAGADAPRQVELTLEELLPFAMQLHRDGRLDSALRCYESYLHYQPEDANALHYLGVLRHQRGQNQQALELIHRSLAQDPNVASWHNNLGNVLLADDQFEAAAKSYARCAELEPANLEVLNNLGVLYRRIGQYAQAEAVLLRAIALSPKAIEARNNLANVYVAQERYEDAFSQFVDALALSPNNLATLRLLTLSYGRAGRMEEGLAASRQWLEQAPGNPQAQHFHAAYGGVPTPERASDAYVQSEFDDFAKSFDAKLASLEYRAPQRIGDTVARVLGAPQANLRILDAGCGTGLCAAYLRPYAQHLVGVDLSAKMLERAGEKGGYDQLVQAELVDYILGCVASCDLVVSADTLCYFGRLDAAFAAVRQALRARGHWVFTVEGHDHEQDFKLHTHGRYSHARPYLATALAQAGFDAVDITQVVLRMEGGKPVSGWLVCAS